MCASSLIESNFWINYLVFAWFVTILAVSFLLKCFEVLFTILSFLLITKVSRLGKVIRQLSSLIFKSARYLMGVPCKLPMIFHPRIILTSSRNTMAVKR